MLKKTILGAAVMATLMGNATSAEPMGPLGVELTNEAKVIFLTTMADSEIKSKNKQEEILCLAQNIYFESRAESMSGKAAVGNVTKNRVEDDRWPNTYCGVVGEGPVRESWKTKKDKNLKDSERVYYPKKHRCQFSWYCDGAADVIWANYEKTGEHIEGNKKAWQDSLNVAVWVTGWSDITIKDNSKGAVFYYNHHLVSPGWADTKEFIGVLGNHTFMK